MKGSMQVQNRIDQLQAYRAAEWMHVLKSGSEAERLAFDQWLRQSPVHVEQFLETIATDRELQQLMSKADEDIGALIRHVAPNVIALKAQPSLCQRMVRTPARVGRKKLIGTLAAGIVVGIVAYLLGMSSVLTPPWSSSHIDTAIGEQRSLTLDDGSLVTLNTRSEIRVNYSDQRRNIDLESGEAIFKVAHEVARPFEVHTRLATVRAVGTQFNVYQRSRDALVSVLEGRVHVAARNGSRMQILEAGEEARVLENGRILKRAHPDVQKTLAWRQRRLSFDEAVLEEIVREFNRYNSTVQLKVEGIDPRSHRYGGIFDADDPDSFVRVLQDESDLIVERHGKEILIRPRTMRGKSN